MPSREDDQTSTFTHQKNTPIKSIALFPFTQIIRTCVHISPKTQMQPAASPSHLYTHPHVCTHPKPRNTHIPLTQPGASPLWKDVEACLWGLRSIAQHIPADEATVMPGVMQVGGGVGRSTSCVYVCGYGHQLNICVSTYICI